MPRGPWRVVTLDATGTLFRPRESIGRTYVHGWEQVAREKLPSERRDAAEKAINARFPAAFRSLSASDPNFGAGSDSTSAFPWWKRLVLDVVNDRDVFPSAPLPRELEDPFARALYEQFASAGAWKVYDDVLPTLDRLKDQGVALGVISNFDERLAGVLRGHGLDSYFDVVTTSFQHGLAKPHASIFEATFDALMEASGSHRTGDSERYDTCLHIGDHRVKDYDGARAAGASARLLVRHPERPGAVPAGVECDQVISTLLGLFGQ